MARYGRDSTRKTRTIWIQRRDLEMLRSIGTARLLTAQALEWLHFNGWRDRYKEALAAARAPNKPLVYYPARRLYTRLAGLEQHGLILRISRTTEQGILQFRALPDGFALTTAGAGLLGERLGIESAELSVFPRRQRAIQNLEHTIAIGQLYAALCAELRYRNLDLSGWAGDHLLHFSYDQVYAIGGDKEKTSVIPDATFVLSSQRYFVEIDRGTRPLKTWATKTYAYEAYRSSSALRDRYGVSTFKVLIVAPDKNRLHRIATEIATVTQHATQDYLFTQESMIHPMTIRKGWYVLMSATPRKKHVVDRIVASAEIELSRCVLWENLDNE